MIENPAGPDYDFRVDTAVSNRRGNRHTGAQAPSMAFFCAPSFDGGRCEAGLAPGQSPSAGFPLSHRLPPLRGKRPAGPATWSLS